MKCLSIRQPYAELILLGRKTVELRTWNTRFRGRFLIHAPATVEKEACARFGLDPDALPRMAVVGSAVLSGVVKYSSREELMRDSAKHLASGKYLDDTYGFVLKDVSRIRPFGMPGRLGFFEVPLPEGLASRLGLEGQSRLP